MLGERTFAWIDQQLRQVSGKQDSLFGGFSLILIGDFAQLPPVADRPLYAVDKPDAHGHILYRQFDTVVILEEIVRQSGASQEQVLFFLDYEMGNPLKRSGNFFFQGHHKLLQTLKNSMTLCIYSIIRIKLHSLMHRS